MAAGRGTPATWARRAGGPLLAVVVPWLVARAIVLGGLGVAHRIVDKAHPTGAGVAARVHEGLLGWDAGWYESIARVGYVPLGHQSLRFFPLFPLMARVVAYLPGVDDGAAVVIVANLSALVAAALLYVLVRRELGDEPLARRTVWLLCLAPPAFTLVMGYAEATMLVCTVACFLCIRPAAHRRPAWWWAAAWGLAAGLTRPLGVLLVLAVAVEAIRRWREEGTGERVASLVAVAGPLAGLAIYLGWAQAAVGDFFLPLRVQTETGHHGGLTNPFSTVSHDLTGAFHHHVGTALHVPWVLLCVVLVVVVWRRLPASYGVFATAVLLLAVSGSNLDSFERYALSAFPLVMAGGTLTAGPRVERTVLTLAAAGLLGYAVLAFLNLYVPTVP